MRKHSTAQHSTAQHSTAQHSTAQHSTAQVDNNFFSKQLGRNHGNFSVKATGVIYATVGKAVA